jgi:threonine dehydratase
VKSLGLSDILDAQKRIEVSIIRTPLLSSDRLNAELGHEVLFKMEGLQRIHAFKARGALNALLRRSPKPSRVTAYSSGNHAQGVAWAAKSLGVGATIFIPKEASVVKIEATRALGAEVVVTENRAEAEAGAKALAEKGAFLIPPFDHDDVIAGQGTAMLEAIQQGAKPDAIFAPCGGGGLLSGTYIVASALLPNAKVFAAEPLLANDAAESVRRGEIVRIDASKTAADGARTPSICPRTFQYLKRLDGFFEIPEEEFLGWATKLSKILETAVEPTSALAMAAAKRWAAGQKTPKNILVILSGGNV